MRFKRLTMRQSPKKIIIKQHRENSTPSALVSTSSCILAILALSMLGGEAYCVILAHHRGAARRFLKNSENLRKRLTANFKFAPYSKSVQVT